MNGRAHQDPGRGQGKCNNVAFRDTEGPTVTRRRAQARGGMDGAAAGPLRRRLGYALAVLALLVQAVLPLADALWHAGDHGHGLELAAGPDAAAPSGKPAPHHPGLADDGCQLCLAIQFAGATLPGQPPAPAAPVTSVRLDAAPAPRDAPTAARPEPQQPRAPPSRA